MARASSATQPEPRRSRACPTGTAASSDSRTAWVVETQSAGLEFVGTSGIRGRSAARSSVHTDYLSLFVDHGATVKVVVCHGKSIVVVLLELVGCTDSHACALASYYRDGFPRRGGCVSELRRDRGNLSVEPANIINFVVK